MNVDLLRKFLQGQASPEEAADIIKWLYSHEGEEYISSLFDNFDEKSNTTRIDSETILNKLHDRINIEELIKSLDIYYQHHEPVTVIRDRPSISIKNKKIKRKWNFAIYSLLTIIFMALTYFIGSTLEDNENLFSDEIKIIEKKTEKGQKLIIHLSDGSKVTMNAATTIMYQENFNDSMRVITLLGEAFFEVREDSLRPFIVKTGKLTTRALGTSFNVLYRPDIDLNEIALVKGKVKVDLLNYGKNESLVLSPGEMADLDFASNKLIEKTFGMKEVTAWKEGIIYFDQANYREIVNTLENWYDIKISTIGQPKRKWKFSAHFENENLITILDALKYAQNINYEIENRTVKIIFKEAR